MHEHLLLDLDWLAGALVRLGQEHGVLRRKRFVRPVCRRLVKQGFGTLP